jgi:hypothetical protein
MGLAKGAEMRTLSTVLFLFLLIASTCFATVDPDPDQIGIYFDRTADTNWHATWAGQLVYAFVVITNPSSTEILGLEYSLCTEFLGGTDGMLESVSEEWPNGMILQPTTETWCSGGRTFSFPTPVLPSGTNAVIVKITYIALGPAQVNFFLGPHPVQSIADGLPSYIGADGQDVPLGVSSGDINLPVASINSYAPVGIQHMTIGGLKCLYR